MKKIGKMEEKISHKDTRILRRNYFFLTCILGAFVSWWQKGR